MSSRTGSAREGKGKGKGAGRPGSSASAGGKKEWKEYKDPATFASEEVSCIGIRDVSLVLLQSFVLCGRHLFPTTHI